MRTPDTRGMALPISEGGFRFSFRRMGPWTSGEEGVVVTETDMTYRQFFRYDEAVVDNATSFPIEPEVVEQLHQVLQTMDPAQLRESYGYGDGPKRHGSPTFVVDFDARNDKGVVVYPRGANMPSPLGRLIDLGDSLTSTLRERFQASLRTSTA